MQHVFIAPPPPLAQFIERFWYSSDAPPHLKVRIVPIGTMELVFNLDEDELGIHDTEQPAWAASTTSWTKTGIELRSGSSMVRM
jgi:Domain of unknown function (DUF6597)